VGALGFSKVFFVIIKTSSTDLKVLTLQKVLKLMNGGCFRRYHRAVYEFEVVLRIKTGIKNRKQQN